MRPDPKRPYLLDTRSDKEAHADFVEAVANARCRAAKEYRYDPYIPLGSQVIESHVGYAHCTLKHGHEGFHETIVGGKPLVF